MDRFDLQTLRDIADEGIARHGLRGYARKLGLDVSTMRSLRDGRDMQISKLIQIVEAMGMGLMLGPAQHTDSPRPLRPDAPAAPAISGDLHVIPYHASAAEVQGSRMQTPIALDADWLRMRGWPAQDLRCIVAPETAHGAALGCVTRGSLCILDCSEAWPSDHALWAFIESGKMRLGHVGRPAAGTLIFAGDALCAAPRMVTGAELERIQPLGRVVWAGAPPCAAAPRHGGGPISES